MIERDHNSPSLPEPQPGRWKMLNLTWLAFFLTFIVWYNLGPFNSTIAKLLHLTKDQSQVLMLCNLALTIPARVAIGMLVDRFGPRKVYTSVLLFAAIPTLGCAFANQFWQLVVCRLLISCVGAGFVVGIRLVGEWFDAREIGLAEGIYGGLGNFGMAAATFGLPLIAMRFGATNGWRVAMGTSAVLCLLYASVFYFNVKDAPANAPFRKPKGRGALEVTSHADLLGLIFMQVPMIICLGITAWRLHGVGFLPAAAMYGTYAALLLLLVQQITKILKVNRPILSGAEIPAEDKYDFRQVAILCLCYASTFGGELAVEQMLPGYFEKMFGVSVTVAGIMGGGFAFANFIARPLGGWVGDKLGRKRTIIVAMFGAAMGYLAIRMIGPSWSEPAAVATVMTAGFFLMAANGANFSIAPLIRKPLTGQIAGLIGAYGSVGSVSFVTVLLLAGPKVFFMTMAVTSAAAFLACFFLIEPAKKPVARRVMLEESPTLELAGARL